MNQSEWFSLRDYVKSLLTAGKRSKDDEFQILMRIYTSQHITDLANAVLEEMKRERVQKEK